MRKGNVTKYIQKLKENNLAALVVGQNNGLGLKEVYHPGKYNSFEGFLRRKFIYRVL